jgi:pimeloyl-ACP methyl ester carboxylesterase
MGRIRSILAAACLAAAAPPASATAAFPAGPMTWTPCPPDVTEGEWPELGDRLRCARVPMPLDHAHPDHRYIEVGVVRVGAGRPAEREGTLFVNNGGPGGRPAAFIASMVTAFNGIDTADPLEGNKRTLSDRFDVVAVIPRGLPGGWEFDCVSDFAATHEPLDTHLDDANWAKAVSDARRLAASCSRPVESAYISTWQHVHDMEAVRAALGERRIHFFGVSYGGKVGAWYAALFPQRLGRLLLDSSMTVPGRFIDAIYLSNGAQKESATTHHARDDDEPDTGPFSESVYHATLCNDDYWEKRETHIRARNERDAYQYPGTGGVLAILQLVCAAWPHPTAPQPNMDPLVAKPFLLLQSERELVTPLAGARAMASHFPNARLVVVRGSTIHGLLGDTASPCVERDAIRYLVDGRLPYETPGEYSCEFVPLPNDGDDHPEYEYVDWHPIRS